MSRPRVSPGGRLRFGGSLKSRGMVASMLRFRFLRSHLSRIWSGKPRRPGLSSSSSVLSEGNSDRHAGHSVSEQEDASMLRSAVHLLRSSGSVRNPRFWLTFNSWRLARCDRPGGSDVSSILDRSSVLFCGLAYCCNTRFAASTLFEHSFPGALKHQFSKAPIHCDGASLGLINK